MTSTPQEVAQPSGSATTPRGTDRGLAARKHLWKHFTRESAYGEGHEVPIIVRGEGAYIWDDRGRRYLDGLAGLFVVQAGHGRHELAEAAAKQARDLAFFPLWSYAHPTAIDLAERGHLVSPTIAALWQRAATLLGGHPGFAEGFLPGGKAPKAGELFVNKPIARSLRLGGWGLSPVTTRFPFGTRSLEALTRVGFIGRVPDPELAAMARVYRMRPLARLRHVVLPQLAPYVTAAARGGIAVIWKIVLVVEFLGRSNGVGFKIHSAFQQFRVDMVLVYALSFVVVMLLVEALVLRPAETRARAWRTA